MDYNHINIFGHKYISNKGSFGHSVLFLLLSIFEQENEIVKKIFL